MGFLAHLAGLAQGVKPAGAARVSLPPRFAEASSGAGEPFGEAVDESRAAPAAPQSSNETMRRIEATPTSIRPWGPGERRDEPAVAIPSRPISPPSKPSPAQDEARPVETARPMPAGRVLDGVRSERPAATTVQLDAVPPSLSRPLTIPVGTAPMVDRSSHGGEQREPVTAAPLSDTAVAARARAPREERPVIHVTIDRLEVRAPAAPKAVAERRKSRPLPSQSLADYLRGGAGGGRR